MKKGILILSFIIPLQLLAQPERAYNWVFGDSTGLNFSSGVPVPFSTGPCTMGENCASISDTLGNLKFYIGKPSVSFNFYNLAIYNSNHQIIQGGDSILSSPDINSSIIFLQEPAHSSLFYLIYINGHDELDTNFPQGVYYSVVDANANAGAGKCIVRNQPLIDSIYFSEHIAAVRHANGRDWWILTYETLVDSAITFLLDTSGIHGPFYQPIQIGYQLPSNAFGQMVFSKDGSKVGLVENLALNIFDFDRCTGLLTNGQYYSCAEDLHIYNSSLYGCAFSSSGQYFYFGSWQFSNYHDTIYQMNVTTGQVVELYGDSSASYTQGQFQLASNDKIYVASSTINIGYGISNYGFKNTHMSVINNPNASGISCNLTPYSFDLGGRRCFTGLPNMPNYGLYQLPGSPCDTLGVGINETGFNTNIVWGIYPNPAQEYFSVFITNPKMQDKYEIKVYDMVGRNILQQKLCGKDGECKMETIGVTPGLYMVELEMNGVRLGGKKLVIE